MFYRKPFDDLDTSIARLAALIRLADHVSDLPPEDRGALQESQGFLFELLITECHQARQHFDALWRTTVVANDARVG